jgi:hypothetical protein
MGLQGLINLKKFAEQGGTLIVAAGTTSIPITFGLVEGISITEARLLQARGTVVSANIADAKSPIAYGYGPKLAVYFNQSPVLRVGLAGAGGGFGASSMFGATEGRPSGRGSATDPDIPQGRAWQPPERPQRRSPGEEETNIPDEARESLRGFLPSPEAMPRVVLRFAEEKELAVSGMLAGGSELAQKAAVVDVPVGKGHIVLFANNPMWRGETQGSYFLIFNTLLNYDHLGAGRPAPKPAAKKQ